MRRNAISSAVQEEEAEINMTPMLDVVFIMLIFFIVTANFIKEPGLEINRPESNTSETQENAAILIAVGASGEIWMDGRGCDNSAIGVSGCYEPYTMLMTEVA